MNQTPTLESFSKEFTEEFIEEFCDDAKHNRRLELFQKIYGQSSTTSTPRQSIYRNHEAGHQRLVNDYFSPNPVYPENIFRQRFRMGRHIFLRIVDAISNFDPYFQQMIDAVRRKGLSPLLKCIVAMRMLAYGVSVDHVDDYIRIGESTAVECLKKKFSTMESILNGQHSSKQYLVHIVRKKKLFAKYQESQRKDVERVFGVLQSRFTIVRGPIRFWDRADLRRIMRACIIIHNMIVEDESDTYAIPFGPLPTYDDTKNGLPEPNLVEKPFVPYETYVQNSMRMRDRQTHLQLKNDLVEHISQFHNIVNFLKNCNV
ncbi:uncharacterized protein LOC141700495 [Apium graveolens]|uniref:uncharacterized protein LOC141700495 n=1 Tax=Apium graveolens TaxID=4045 RepID=UPI003D7BCDAE